MLFFRLLIYRTRKFTLTAGKLNGGILEMYLLTVHSLCSEQASCYNWFSAYISISTDYESARTKPNPFLQWNRNILQSSFGFWVLWLMSNNREKCSKLWFQENTGPDAWWSWKKLSKWSCFSKSSQVIYNYNQKFGRQPILGLSLGYWWELSWPT